MRINIPGQGYNSINPRTAITGVEFGLDAALVGTELYSPGSLPVDHNLLGYAAWFHGVGAWVQGLGAAGQLLPRGMDDGFTDRDRTKLGCRSASEAIRTGGYLMLACGPPQGGAIVGGAVLVGLGTVADILTSYIHSDASNI